MYRGWFLSLFLSDLFSPCLSVQQLQSAFMHLNVACRHIKADWEDSYCTAKPNNGLNFCVETPQRHKYKGMGKLRALCFVLVLL